MARLTHTFTVAAGWKGLQVAGEGVQGKITDVRASASADAALTAVRIVIAEGAAKTTLEALAGGADPVATTLLFDEDVTPVPGSATAELPLDAWERDITVGSGFTVGVDMTAPAPAGSITVIVTVDPR